MTVPTVVVRHGRVDVTPLLAEPDVDAVVVPVAPAGDGEGIDPRAGTADLAARYGVDLAELAARTELDAAPGRLRTLQLPMALGDVQLPWAGLTPRVVLLGIGTGSPTDMRATGAALAGSVHGLRRVVTTAVAEADADAIRAFVEGYLLACYRHPRTTNRPNGPGPAVELILLGDVDPEAVERARRTARATWLARTLTATPASVATPQWLADRAVQAAADAGCDVEVLGPAELVDRGFRSIIAVGQGSAAGPRLVTVRYRPADRAQDAMRIALVGKGITFDTGGLSIKPRDAMIPMKTDMAGAAVVLATVLAAAEAGLPHEVIAVLPLAENAVGADSYRPGDVVRSYGGTTIEVVNTDAEGRMVLADVLEHVDRDLDPDVVVDVATLTGAATAGLGKVHGALLTADDGLADDLIAAGVRSGEPLWRLPLVEDYRSALDSPIADVRHVSGDPTVGAGAITAALFLQRFAGDRRWAHLDVAGPARASAARAEIPEGATGFGVRVLLDWLAAL